MARANPIIQLHTVAMRRYNCNLNSEIHTISNPNVKTDFSGLVESPQSLYAFFQEHAVDGLGDPMIRKKFSSLHRELVEYINAFHSFISLMIDLIPPNKQKKLGAIQVIFSFVSRISSFLIMADALPITNAKNNESVADIIKGKPIRFLGTMNQYTQYFITKLKLELPYFAKANNHSKSAKGFVEKTLSGSAQMVQLKDGNMVNAMEILASDIGSPMWQFHASRRYKCAVYAGPSIDGNLDFLLHGKTIVAEFIDSKLTLYSTCTSDFSKDDEKQCICGEQIIWYPLQQSSIQLIENHRQRPWSEQNVHDWNLYFEKYIRANIKTLFPEQVICRCPDTKCLGNQYFLIPEHAMSVSVECIFCIKAFCTTCNIFQNHSNDGRMCNVEKFARLSELGVGSTMKACPNRTCPQLIEKSMGCNKMKCDTTIGGCGTTFCYECGCKSAIQKADIVALQQHFVTLGHPIMIVGGFDFGYFHIPNQCAEAGNNAPIFKSIARLSEFTESYIRYEDHNQLTEGDMAIVMAQLQDAIIRNS